MRLLKIDSSHPQVLFDLLKQMNIPEGTELQIEQEANGSIHLKPTNYLTFEEQKDRLMKLVNFEISVDDAIETIQNIQAARTVSESSSLD